MKTMKKIGIILTIILNTGISTNLFAQKERKLTNGFSINLVTGFPSAQYGSTKDGNVSPEMQAGTIWGLQLGNRWYFSPREKYGIGLMVNWLDITAGVATGSTNNYDFGRAVADVSFLEFGPLATYLLTEKIALDAYYNLRPTGFSTVTLFTYPSGTSEDATYTWAGAGFTHAFATALRYKALNIGLEYVFGGTNMDGAYSGPQENVKLSTYKSTINNLRVLIGAKF